MPCRLVAGRSGWVNSARNPMCGRDGVVDLAARTFSQELREKYRQAVGSRNYVRSFEWSSSSFGK